ncbi:MAG: methyltransferase domain-containing protein [Bacillota bacterium]|nr:methyltransferase domain-containing protein [Bacillota bacterium]
MEDTRSGSKTVNQVWDRVWTKYEIPAWDPLSENILGVLRREVGSFHGKKILEPGCGSGRISLRLAQEGAEVTLLDASPEALRLCTSFFAAAGVKGTFTEGFIEQMPYPDDSFDVVWNAGVLEHFTFEQQLAQLREMVRVCRDGGLIVTINPYAGAVLYQLGKWYANLTGTWDWGTETPVTSLRSHFQRAGIRLRREYSVDFGTNAGFLSLAPGGGVLAKYFELCFDQLPPEQQAKISGYCLVSVGVVDKSQRPPAGRAANRRRAERRNGLPDIICLSCTDWTSLKQRPQHLAQALVDRGHRVVYVNADTRYLPAPQGIARLSAEAERQLIDPIIQTMARIGRNLYAITPITLAVDPATKECASIRTPFLRSLLRVMGVTRPIFLVQSPHWADTLAEFRNEGLIVYDCPSAHPARAEGTPEIALLESRLLAISDLVSIAAEGMRAARAATTDHLYLIPNGANPEDFARPAPAPADLAAIPAPRIGFVGALGDWVDQDLLLHIAQKRPDWSLVLIGPPLTSVDRLKSRPNIHLLGGKPYEELPRYLGNLDVGLIPFSINESTLNSNPIKLYEYLAGGLPVVSTRLPEVVPYASPGIVECVESGEALVNAIERMLRSNTPELAEQRRAIARRESWASRAAEMGSLTLAYHRLKFGPWPEAERAFRRLIQLDPKAEPLRLARAEAAWRAGRERLAVHELKEAARLRQVPWLEELARVALRLHAKGVTGEAVRLLERGLASREGRSAEAADLHYNLCAILAEQGDLNAALAKADAAVAAFPRDASLHNLYGAVLFQAKRWLAARAEFAKALTLDPTLEVAAANLEAIEAETRGDIVAKVFSRSLR